MAWQDFGNFNDGAITAATGLNSFLLHLAPDIHDILSGLPGVWGMACTFFDQPRDQAMITLGTRILPKFDWMSEYMGVLISWALAAALEE